MASLLPEGFTPKRGLSFMKLKSKIFEEFYYALFRYSHSYNDNCIISEEH